MILNELGNYRKERTIFRNRLNLLTVLLAIFTVIITARLFFLQVLRYDLYRNLANQNAIAVVPLSPQRGKIYDRNGILLAENRKVYSLLGCFKTTKERETTLTAISKFLTLPKISENQPLNKQEILKPDLSEKELSTFLVRSYQFPMLQTKIIQERHYLYPELFAHVIGYLGKLDKNSLSPDLQDNYVGTIWIGKSGIEKEYEERLHGYAGYEEVVVNAHKQPLKVLTRHVSKKGQDIFLTLDLNLQRAASRAFGSSKGAVVAINPQNGEILAMVSRPGFDNNLFLTRGPDLLTLLHSKNNPLFNRATKGLYAPGSTIKPFIAIIALDENFIQGSTTILDQGWFKLSGSSRIFHDWLLKGHGRVNISKAIIESSDIFFYRLAFLMGIENLSRGLKKFHFGQKTGLNIEENAGILPSATWKKKYLGKLWSQADTVMAGIGQSYWEVTPVQLATATAILARRGRICRPHLVLSQKTKDFAEELNHPTITKQTWSQVINAMSQVTTRGTAKSSFGPTAYQVAAKTGTSQVILRSALKKGGLTETHNSLFIAFSPLDSPQLAIAVVVEHNTGNAARVGRQIFDSFYRKKNFTNRSTN